jgi:galactokinase/mevalonate kinase-like predicted kinase
LDKYVYLVVNRRFEEEIRISYSVTEIVKSVDDIRHPVVKERARAKEPCGAQDPYIAAFGGEEGQLV